MEGLLANTQAAADVAGNLEQLQVPSQEQFVNSLSSLEPLWACLLLASGLIYLLQGWKIFKVLVALNAAMLGAAVGAKLAVMAGGGRNMPVFAAIGGGLVLAVLAWPLMKYSISVMGALAGSFVGFGVWQYAAQIAQKPGLLEYAWTGALVGLVTLGLLAFVIFRFVVITFTAFQGSVMTVSGIVGLLLKYDGIAEPVNNALLNNVHLLPLLVGVPAVIGFAVQNTAAIKKVQKKRKAVEGDGGPS